MARPEDRGFALLAPGTSWSISRDGPRGRGHSAKFILAGGEEKQVVTDQVVSRGFAVVANGIYYITSRGKSLFEIRFHEFGRGRSRSIREIEGPLRPGFSVSPDRNTFLFSRASPEADLMLIENFR